MKVRKEKIINGNAKKVTSKGDEEMIDYLKSMCDGKTCK